MAVELPMKVADILRPLGRDVTHISLDVIGNPLRVGQVTVEEEKKLTIPQSRSYSYSRCPASARPPPVKYIMRIAVRELEGENLHGHSAAEDGGNSQISAMPA